MKYTEVEIGVIIRCLRLSKTVRDALDEIERRIGKTFGNTHHARRVALTRLLQRHGLGVPSDYLDDGKSEVQSAVEYGDRPLKRVLIIPDTHVPFESKRAWNLVLQVANQWCPDVVVLLGDFADCYSVSAHSKDPNRVCQLSEEIDAVSTALHQLEESNPNARRVYISGNHEFRLERLIADKAPALYNAVSYPRLLDLERRGWEWVPYREHIQIGKVYYTHDTGSSGKYAHIKSGQTFEHSVGHGHTHALAVSYFGNAVGESHVAGMFGWLGDAEAADYMHTIKAKKDWHLGFGVAYLDPSDGTTFVQPVPIVNYRCVVDGALFSA